jgi:hypothetical protein
VEKRKRLIFVCFETTKAIYANEIRIGRYEAQRLDAGRPDFPGSKNMVDHRIGHGVYASGHRGHYATHGKRFKHHAMGNCNRF